MAITVEQKYKVIDHFISEAKKQLEAGKDIVPVALFDKGNNEAPIVVSVVQFHDLWVCYI